MKTEKENCHPSTPAAGGFCLRWENHVNRILFSMPWRLRWRARALRVFLPYLMGKRAIVYRFRGPAAPSGRRTVLVTAGQRIEADYFVRRFFMASPKREVLGRFPMWTLQRRLEQVRSSADLTIVRADKISTGLWFRHGYIMAPEWIGVQLNLSNLPYISAWKSENIRGDLRRIRLNRLYFTESQDPADFVFFYENMYVPYVRARFGELAAVTPYHYLRHVFLRGGLLFVEQDGRRLAGMLYSHLGQTVKFVTMGARTTTHAPKKMGALAAVYVFGIEQAKRLGCQRIDFGGCRPVLQDGVLRFKAKWRGRITDDNSYPFQYLISWNRLNETVADFFAYNSIIFYDRDGFSALCSRLPEGDSAENPLRIKPSIKGLRKVYVVGGGAETSTTYPGAEVISITAASRPGRFVSVCGEETKCF